MLCRIPRRNPLEESWTYTAFLIHAKSPGHEFGLPIILDLSVRSVRVRWIDLAPCLFWGQGRRNEASKVYAHGCCFGKSCNIYAGKANSSLMALRKRCDSATQKCKYVLWSGKLTHEIPKIWVSYEGNRTSTHAPSKGVGWVGCTFVRWRTFV